jgi:hypothetical protein
VEQSPEYIFMIKIKIKIKLTSLFVFVVPLTETLLDGFSSSESLLVDDEALRFKPLLPLTNATVGLCMAEPE